MTVKMYVLSSIMRDDDYIAVRGNKIVVHSSLLKHIWHDPDHFGDFDKYHQSTFESYYGTSAENVLASAKLIWTVE